jgi:hypothetical protein
MQYGTSVTSLKALLDEGYDAVFVGAGAPKGKELDIPGRWGESGVACRSVGRRLTRRREAAKGRGLRHRKLVEERDAGSDLSDGSGGPCSAVSAPPRAHRLPPVPADGSGSGLPFGRGHGTLSGSDPNLGEDGVAHDGAFVGGEQDMEAAIAGLQRGGIAVVAVGSVEEIAGLREGPGEPPR